MKCIYCEKMIKSKPKYFITDIAKKNPFHKKCVFELADSIAESIMRKSIKEKM